MKKTDSLKNDLLKENEALKLKIASGLPNHNDQTTIKTILSLLDVIKIQREKIEAADICKNIFIYIK